MCVCVTILSVTKDVSRPLPCVSDDNWSSLQLNKLIPYLSKNSIIHSDNVQNNAVVTCKFSPLAKLFSILSMRNV